MKLRIIQSVGLFVLFSVAAYSVSAANVRLRGGASFADEGTIATVCGRLTGLGNQDITLTLVGTGTTTVVCHNPAGNFAPGQPGDVVVGGVQAIPATEVKNGNVSFCISTEAPQCETARDCGCPNNNWTATVTDVDFSSLTLIVEQGGQVVLTTRIR